MTRMIQMLNEDGSPFYVNLHAPSTLSISISEAYSLVDSLKHTLGFNQTLLGDTDVTLPEDTRDLFIKVNAELTARIEQIERVIDHDKYEQWAAVSPAWAIRAGAR